MLKSRRKGGGMPLSLSGGTMCVIDWLLMCFMIMDKNSSNLPTAKKYW
ncbi:hypothetical protein [Nostoc sp.]